MAITLTAAELTTLEAKEAQAQTGQISICSKGAWEVQHEPSREVLKVKAVETGCQASRTQNVGIG